ncbi:MAG TPA: hypothetical protein VK427_08960 [Kofleriaceae bacterium]|nr:hypothetical protein [Kofleriaceae bacterium]
MAEDEIAAVAALISQGEDHAAFTRLRTAFGWPAGKGVASTELPRWLALLGELATRRGATPLAEITAEVVRDPDNPDQLFDLGYSLIDAGAPAVAATVLWQCLALVGESEEVVCELVSALESALAYPDAFAVLHEHVGLRGRSFLCRYLYAFNAAMSGQLAVTRETMATLEAATPEEDTMLGTLRGFLERADRVAGVAPLDERDLRGWHYVLTGGILVHQSPYGFDEPMRGRYAWLGDSHARIATGLERLARLADGLALECVYAPPGRGHEIIAHAVSKKLGLPIVPWPAVGVPAPGLVALYDLADLAGSDITRLQQRRENQIVFAHASPWTEDSPIAPDVTTLLYQTIVPPWGETMVVNAETNEVQTAPPDERPSEVIADAILASPGLDAADREAEHTSELDALLARAWPLGAGPRGRLWAGGPVPSNRFT